MKLFKKKIKFIWLVLFFLLLNPAPVLSETDKEKDIKNLLEVSGILRVLSNKQETFKNSITMMISGAFPKVPDQFWAEFNQLIGEKEMNELIARVIPVYDKHMSHETVKKLIEMFETPFWEEWKKKMPEISREAGVVSSQWGKEISQSIEFNKKLEDLIKKYELEKINKNNKKIGLN